jgi:hypothetical protein
MGQVLVILLSNLKRPLTCRGCFMNKKNENLEKNLKFSVFHAFRAEKYW